MAIKYVEKVRITKLDKPVYGYRYNVQVLSSNDYGRTFNYVGRGKFFKTKKEARKHIKNI